MPTHAELITIGDEILYGQTLDTNAHWISGRLDEIGIKVKMKTTIGDVRQDILDSFRAAEGRADVVIITGGLGPTKDDLTKPLLSEYFKSPLVMNDEALADVEDIFRKHGRPMTEVNRKQAEIPQVATKIKNSLGTAPGMWIEHNNTIFISMPGVPFEMKRMMSDILLPKLKERYTKDVIYHKIIRTIGIGESTLAEIIEKWENELPTHIKLAYLPTLGMVKLRLTATGSDLDILKTRCEELITKVKPDIDQFVYSYEDEDFETYLGRLLTENKMTVSFAESCTGGYVSHLVTKAPGSSSYFKGSIISYAYEVKENELNVDPEIMNKMGAVSEEVVLQMAKSVREKLKTDIGISISGIAGPDGGTEEKPVGTVWISYSDKNKTIAKKFNLSKDRILNIQYSAYMALNMIRLNFPPE